MLSACWSFKLPCNTDGGCPNGLACDVAAGVCRAEVRTPPGDSEIAPSSDAAASGSSPACGGIGLGCCSSGAACAAALICDPDALLCRRCAGFQPLEALSGEEISRVHALSSDGTLAVGSSSLRGATSGPTAVQWLVDSGSVRALGAQLGPVSLSATEALATNQDGSIVVGWANTFSAATPLALRWRPRLAQLAQLAEGRAEGVSADGEVTVGSVDAGMDAFRWSLELGLERLPKMKLDDLPNGRDGSYLSARAVSADGQVVVGEGENQLGPRRAFRWTRGGGSAGLGALPGGVDSSASSANRDGSVVVGASSSSDGWHVFRWRANEPLQAIAPMGADESPPRTNAAGSVVVGASRGVAFVWDAESAEARGLEGLLAPVLPSGWRLEAATGVSDDGGVIVGNGTDPDGAPRAWRAFLGPQCSPTGDLPVGSIPLPGAGLKALQGGSGSRGDANRRSSTR